MSEQLAFDFEDRPTIKGFPELRWTGKRPYRSTLYYPAQLRERYGEEVDGWINRIYWGDNLQVMSHLLKEFRGKIDLIYIDPPFDSKADYKKHITLQGHSADSDASAFEEKQYGDIWSNDEYLQFMYERFILMRELLSDTGSIYVHCDYHRNQYLRCLLDEVFGATHFVNEIIWRRKQAQAWASSQFGVTNDTLLFYSKTSSRVFNPIYSRHDENTQKYIRERFVYDDGDGRKYMKSPLVNPMDRPNLRYTFHGIQPPRTGWLYKQERMEELFQRNELVMPTVPTARIYRKIFADEYKGQVIQNIWMDIPIVNPMAIERIDYPTQKPEALLERIITASSDPGDLVFDCFMGSGTTQAVAMRLGRRFIGADINLGAIQTTTKRLIGLLGAASEASAVPTLDISLGDDVVPDGTGFEVWNVNNYDFFRNPIEARDLLIQALEIQPFAEGAVWDGELGGRMVKIMPINRIATKADLEELKANLPYRAYEKRMEDNPNQPVERITIVCMGHEPDLAASLEADLSGFKLDVEIVDVLRDREDLQLKREAEAEVVLEGGKLVIRSFYPLNLMQKLSLQKEFVEDWRQLVESVMIDWNFDGVVLQPAVTDIPSKTELVQGIYSVPGGAGTIKVKITDLLSESLEIEVP
ncbi:MAG: site-specific DNA-methyltransferase [Propionibacteriaceae bacterium]|nr:site-specific DNA-methyltransferase [Propionibacteriaceae bacterium]